MAKKAIILLKNEQDLLPLDMSKIKSLAVIGPNAVEERPAKGTYSLLGGYSGLPPYYVSVLEGLTNKVGGKININYAQGCNLLSDSKAGFPEAITAANKSDAVVLVIGGSRKTGGEGADRSDLDLLGVQNELVEAIHKTGKPIIVVLLNGRPLTINYIAENIPSILETWYLGMRSGDAIADAIFGDVNPGGKLTVSFPRSAAQIPVTYLERPDFIGSGKGLYKYEDKSPLFPFGYGLSYTTFTYGEPKLASNPIKAGASTSVSIEVSNTGNRAGDEVVQMYIRDDYASVGRYLKMLKGFERISLLPGETKTVTFELNAENLAIYNQEMNKVVEPGTFTISVGSSSAEKDLQNHIINCKIIPMKATRENIFLALILFVFVCAVFHACKEPQDPGEIIENPDPNKDPYQDINLNPGINPDLNPEDFLDPNKIVTINTDVVLGQLYNFWSTRPMVNQTRFSNANFLASLEPIKGYVKEYNIVRILGGRTDNRNTFYQGVDAFR